MYVRNHNKRLKTDNTVDLLVSLFRNVKATEVCSEIPKELEDNSSPFIATHNGKFHCDEALACAMLKTLPQFENMPIIRTRNPDILSKAFIVVDVGGQYDHATRRYDHHQRTVRATGVKGGEGSISTSAASAV